MAVAFPYWGLSALGALATTAVALWIVSLDRRSVPGLAFAVFLVARGVSGVLSTLQESLDYDFARTVMLLNLVATPAFAAATLAFVAVYPRRRAWVGPVAWGALALAVVALGALALARPDLVGATTRSPSGIAVYARVGPLFPLFALGVLAMAGAAFVFARDAAREPAGSRRASLVLVAIGFASYPVFAGVGAVPSLLANLGLLPPPLGSENPWPLGLYGNVFRVVFVAAALLALAASFAPARAARRDASLRPLAVASVAVGLAAAVTALVMRLPGVGPEAHGVARGLWRLPLPVLVTYALVRHRLFDIDLKLKWTIKRGTVAAVFLAVFFVAAEVAQNFLADSLGWAIGGLTAGVLLFAVAPIQRAAERLADAAMPHVADARAPRSDAKSTYRAALEVALADGPLTREEEVALARLARRLALDPVAALEARDAVEAEAAARADA